MFKKIEKQMEQFGGPLWEVLDFDLPEAPSEKHVLILRNVQKCGDHLFRLAELAGQLITKPAVQMKKDDRTRTFQEISDGDDWNQIQASPLEFCSCIKC